MIDFIETPASLQSLSARGTVWGVGINDADYRTSYIDSEGTRWTCPYYQRWKNMLERCYSPSHQERYPTYIGCSVSNNWLLFSNFKLWMEEQNWKGLYLDKDLLIEGNKVYSADTCIFITQRLNGLFVTNHGSRGKYPQGVYWNKAKGKYQAQCRYEGRATGLGVYSCVHTAELAYCDYKSDLVLRYSVDSEAQADIRLARALVREANTIKERSVYLRRIIEEVACNGNSH